MQTETPHQPEPWYAWRSAVEARHAEDVCKFLHGEVLHQWLFD
jgi:hypothetical protein